MEFAEQEGNSSDVVLMPVRQEDAGNFIAILSDDGEVRDQYIDSRFVIGKSHSCIDDDCFTIAAHQHHVEAELAHPSERNYLKFSI